MSERLSVLCPRTFSGAEKPGVPRTVSSSSSSSAPGSPPRSIRARPKSISLASAWPSFEVLTSTFVGLMSSWTRPRAWM
ncbi:hypothetical protein [Pseudenhygromyxa sp. WMMC2535]|uniref:hypothetical protein n=1 Tax=Pseudenhygromyxa sp. WMMC2535 TaxID=2712867 RepID=UPI0020D07BA0|nr:hypothetical protein [Pseudenhygromyxa sp. WMMC2535]